MIKLGLTGNIASGKSQAEKFFLSKNIPVIDADEVCRDLLANDLKIIEIIKNKFADFDILTEGNLDRKKLANILYSDKKAKQELEKILHPPIIEKIKNFFDMHKSAPLVVASVPLLFEIQLEEMFDKILLISANEDIRLSRLMKRNNITKEFAQKMISAQIPEREKIDKSDFVVYNNENLEEFFSELDVFLLNIKQMY